MKNIYEVIDQFVGDIVPDTNEKEEQKAQIKNFCRGMLDKLPEIPLEEILAKIAKIKGVTAKELKSKRKLRSLAYTRCAFVEIASMTYPNIVLKVIGEVINKDHSTVFAMKKEIERVKEKREFFEQILKAYRNESSKI